MLCIVEPSELSACHSGVHTVGSIVGIGDVDIGQVVVVLIVVVVVVIVVVVDIVCGVDHRVYDSHGKT